MAADTLEQLNTALVGRYAIERELGRGATAIVYLAEDLKHKRKVAVKVLNPELALAVRSERFLREIQIAAQLNHPHILPVYDSGQAGDFLFYVMPVVSESLRDRLKREQQLPLEEALRLAREVADALGYAHQQGIIHRDVKPENILLNQGHALVADFGIARALSAVGSQSLTDGIALGTPAYMSPEQGTASPQVDARSDLYALACVLYEMLAGHPPFTGTSAQEILSRHALDPMPTLRSARAGVPPAVERAVAKALAKQPADRFATAGEFARELENSSTGEHTAMRLPKSLASAVFAGIAIVLLFAGFLLARRLREVGTTSGTGDNSLAVLPCTSVSTDSVNEIFSQGMAEELIDIVSAIPRLRVAAFTSSLAVKGRNLAPAELGATLGVAHYLECSVRRSGGRLRVRASLVRAEDGTQVWGQTYDRELNQVRDVIEVQESIARAVAQALPLGGTAPSVLVPTMDSLAYDFYQRGQYLSRPPDAENTLKAIAFLDSAVKRDPTFALAYVRLSQDYTSAGTNGFLPRREGYEKARAAAITALRLNKRLSDAHLALGAVFFWADWDWAMAEREFGEAIKLNPSSARAHETYGYLLAVVGKTEQAVEEARLARMLDRLAQTTVIGVTFMLAGHYDEAIAEMQRVIDLAPRYVAGHGALCRAYLYANRLEDAVQSCEKSAELRPQNPPEALAYVYAKVGRQADSKAILAYFEARQGEYRSSTASGQVPWGRLAWAYLGLNEREKAVQALVAALKSRNVDPRVFREPVFNPLRDDPRLVETRRAFGLQ